jgi:hypothetical protein
LTTTEVTPPSPFKFLNYYAEEDEKSFAGRSSDAQEILAVIARGRTAVLYGRSGLGKTSLLLASVVPELRKLGYDPVYIRHLESPVADLCAAVGAALHTKLGPDKLPAALTAPTRPVVLILDQLEEIFVRSRDRASDRREVTELFAVLAAIVRTQGTSVHLVLSLREDYYAELLGFTRDLEPGDIPSYRLEPLTAYGARQAIVRPLKNENLVYDESLIRLLVDEVAKFDFDPLILQILCTEVFRAAAARDERPVHLTTADFEKSGGAVGVFRRYIEGVGAGMEGDQSLLMRAILDAMITGERTKRSVSASELADRSGGAAADAGLPLLAGRASSRLSFRATAEEILTILDLLRDKRLVRRVESGRYELLHDRLVAIVREWLASDEVFVRFRFAKTFIANLSEAGAWRSGPIAPLSVEQLRDLLDPWKGRLGLSEREADFVLRSSVQAQSETVADWAAIYDELRPGGAVELIASLLESSVPGLRENAAFAAGRIAGPSGANGSKHDLPLACLVLSIGDPSPEVRRAAGTAVARVGGDAELALLHVALSAHDHRKRTIEVLADLHQHGHSIESFPWFVRWKARRIAAKRKYHEHRDAIHGRAVVGSIVGLIGGVVWTTVVGSLSVMSFVTVYRPVQTVLEWPGHLFASVSAILGLLIVPAVAVGAFFGWRTAVQAARASSETNGDAGPSMGTRGWGQILVTGFVALLVALALYEELSFEDNLTHEHDWRIALAIISVLTPALCRVAAGPLLRLARRCAGSTQGLAAMLLWTSVCSIGPVFLGAELLEILFAPVITRLIPGLRVLLFTSLIWPTLKIAAIVLGFRVFIAGASLAFSQARLPMGERPVEMTSAARRRLRVVSAGSLAAFALSSWALGSHNVLPMFATQVKLAPGKPSLVQSQLLSYRTDIAYFSLQPPDDKPTIVTIDVQPPDAQSSERDRPHAIVGGKGIETFPAQVLLTGTTLAAISNGVQTSRNAPDKISSGRFWSNWNISANMEPIVETEGEIEAIPTGRWIFGRAPVVEEKTSGGRVSSPHVPLRGKLAPGSFHSGAEVVVMRFISVNGSEPEDRWDGIPADVFGRRRTDTKRVESILMPSLPWGGEWTDREVQALLPSAAIVASEGDWTIDAVIWRVRDPRPIFVALSRLELPSKPNPDLAPALNGVAWRLVAQKRWSDALVYARLAFASSPSMEVADTLAHAAYCQGEWTEAATAWDKAFALGLQTDSEELCKYDVKKLEDARENIKTGARPSTPKSCDEQESRETR